MLGYCLDDDNFMSEIINAYSDESQNDRPQSTTTKDDLVKCEDERQIPPVTRPPRKHARFALPESNDNGDDDDNNLKCDDPATLKRQFEEALRQHELAQLKLQQLSQKFKQVQLH